MDWWTLFGTLTLVHISIIEQYVNAHESTGSSCNTSVPDAASVFMDLVLGRGRRLSCDLIPPPSEWKKPVCKLGEGCDIPLNCFNYSTQSDYESGQTRKVTPIELELVLENPSVTNTCAVVMFYVPYCPYSVDFGRRYNALGRSYRELPVLAVDFTENDLYKYIAVYVPLVNFYYRGRVTYRFTATESLQELQEQITLMTNFTAVEVDLSQPENDYPVPTARVDGDRLYLITASSWIVFILMMLVCSTRTIKHWLSRITVKLKK